MKYVSEVTYLAELLHVQDLRPGAGQVSPMRRHFPTSQDHLLNAGQSIQIIPIITKVSIKDYLLLIYTFMCMIIFLRILSFQSHQTRILSAGLGMAWNRDGLSCNAEKIKLLFCRPLNKAKRDCKVF